MDENDKRQSSDYDDFKENSPKKKLKICMCKFVSDFNILV